MNLDIMIVIYENLNFSRLKILTALRAEKTGLKILTALRAEKTGLKILTALNMENTKPTTASCRLFYCVSFEK